MNKDNFNIGMYIIDKDYHILNCNQTMKEMYPEVKEGDICHKALAYSDAPCATCPLVNNDILFFNPMRKEWITANAAIMEYPGHGECFNVQFKSRKNIGYTEQGSIRMEKVDEYIKDLQLTKTDECIIGAYYDPGSPIFYANEQMIALMGYESLEEMLETIEGLTVNIIHPEDRKRVRREMGNCNVEGAVFETTSRILKKDCTWLWVVMKGKTFKTASGKLANLCTCADMTSFIRQHSELEEQNQVLINKDIATEAFMTQIPGGYHSCAAEEGYPFLYISDSFAKIVGWTREEIRDNFDNKFINMVWPEDLYLFDNLLTEIDKYSNASTIYRIKHKDGGFRWVQDSTMYVEMEGVSFYQCTLADITEFVEQQEELTIQTMELKQKEDLFENIAKNMPSGYHRCSTDDGFKLTFISDSFLEIVGWSREELETEMDNQYLNLVAPEDRKFFMAHEPSLMRNGRIDLVYRILRKDGTKRWVQDSTMRIAQEGEEFYQCTLADITEYVEKLQEEKERAEAANRAKSTFLFNASHDIRTPMNAIQGFTRMIKENPEDAELVRTTVAKIEKSGEILMKLLSNVLELSRIESGKETVESVLVDLESIAEKFQSVFGKEMEELGITFVRENNVSNGVVWCDELKLTQIGMNMLSNAKKFTSAGGTITYGVKQLSEPQDGQAIYRFYVKDTGIGMSEEFLSRAFEQFERERSTTESGVIGSGLGLSIIKKMTELMGGTCTLDSELGKGTEIAAIIKLRVAGEETEKKEEESSKEYNFSGKRILLVEDNDFNREIVRYILENLGITVEEAENGSVAVEMVLNAGAGHYDLILMDIQMPIMDGYTATQEIRRIKDAAVASVPIIAMTANAFKEDEENCLKAGMNGHLAKPVDNNLLLETLAKVL